MKMAPDEVDLPHYEHMNRAQRRAFLLRDQLKYEEDSHLDAFIAGICSPEPPQYRRTSSGIQPPYKEVTIKQNTTRFDLGNVEFEDKSVRRVYLACVEDSFEMHELKPLSEDEDAFNAVPINYHVAQHIMPVYQKKYEAIYARVQRINAMRKHLYEHVRTGPPHTSTRFKEGQSLAKLMSSVNKAGTPIAAEETLKRPGEPLARHPLNRKKRISIDNVSSRIKTETVDRLPDQVKVEMFNAFVKSAFPDLDDLLMASWNVVSIFVNVGSEDLMLHNSIGDLHDVLRKFDQYFERPKKRSESSVGGRQSNIRTEQGGHRTFNGSKEASRRRSSDGIVEWTPNSHGDTVEYSPVHPFEATEGLVARGSNGYHKEPQANLHQNRTLVDPTHKPTTARQPDNPNRPASRNLTPRSHPGDRPLPQTLANLHSSTPAKESRTGSHNLLNHMASRLESESLSGIEKGYADMQEAQTQQLLSSDLRDDNTSPKPNTPPAGSPTSNIAQFAEASTTRNRIPQPRSQSQREAQRYGMFKPRARGDSIDALFVGDDEDENDEEEAIEVPAMEEVHEQEKGAEPKPVSKTVSLGKSLLGAPKNPPKSTGSAPVAPMIHNSAFGKKGEGEKRA